MLDKNSLNVIFFDTKKNPGFNLDPKLINGPIVEFTTKTRLMIVHIKANVTEIFEQFRMLRYNGSEQLFYDLLRIIRAIRTARSFFLPNVIFSLSHKTLH